MRVTFPISPEVQPPKRLEAIDHADVLRRAFRRPVEASSRPESSAWFPLTKQLGSPTTRAGAQNGAGGQPQSRMPFRP
jgi:hypothetical protein